MENWEEKLRELGDALIAHPAHTQLSHALRFLRKTLGARAAACVQSDQVIAHDGHHHLEHEAIADEPSILLAQLAAEQGVPVRVDDTQDGPFASRADGEQLWSIGYTAALAVPLRHRNVEHGGIVLWFGEVFDDDVDPTQLPANYILSAVRQVLTLAFERDSQAVLSEGAAPSPLGLNRLAALGLKLDEALPALRGPSSSLGIQLDELRRLADEMSLLADASDHPLNDAFAELMQTLDDMTLTAALVGREIASLSDLSTSQDKTERVQLSRIIHESVVIARPELENRGFTVSERVIHDGYMHGDRNELLHLTLGLLFAWTSDDEGVAHAPVIEIQLTANDDFNVITVLALGPATSPAPAPPAACLRIVAAHGGHLSSSPGLLEVIFPNQRAASTSTSTLQRPKRVLLVDDDLVFARALRRALNPHDVRVCGSAAEAEIALMEPGYEPDMVICDLELPGAHGRVLHERISLSQPGIAPRFVFVSGSPVRFEDTTYFASTGCPSLAKPLVVADLMALLESDEGPRTQSFIDQNRELE